MAHKRNYVSQLVLKKLLHEFEFEFDFNFELIPCDLLTNQHDILHPISVKKITRGLQLRCSSSHDEALRLHNLTRWNWSS